MKTEYCILVADPRGSGNFRPLENTVSTSRDDTRRKLRSLRIAFPNAQWAMARREPAAWQRMED